MKKNKKKMITGLIGGVVLLGLNVGYAQVQKIKAEKEYIGAEVISYADFIEKVDGKEVEEVRINFGKDKFYFLADEGKIYETENPKYSEFKKDLLEKDLKVVTLEETKTNLATYLTLAQFGIYGVLLYVLLNKLTPNFGDKKSSIVSKKPNIKFSDIAGLDESKADIEHLVQFLKSPESYIEAGAKLPKGIVLYGPPGTGKTLTAKAIAGEANVPFLSVSGSDFIEMYAGLGARRVRKLFEEARSMSPCIIFIDEIDAIGGKRSTGPSSGESNQTINALLSEMDGFSTKDGIIVLAATNRIGDLDPALVRPGRFDRHVAINLPDLDGRREILKLHLKNKKVNDSVNLEDWAKMTIGFSGAALEMLMNEATIQAVNHGSSVISTEDIDEAYYKTVMKGSKKKRGKDYDNKEIKLIAYHEAGHALAAKMLTDNDVPRVTIIPSTSGAGGVTFNIPKKMGLMTKAEVLANIKVLYAGRAAEEILAGGKDGITTGASSDIERATEYIMAYYEEFGFSEEFGMLKLDRVAEKGYYTEEAKKLSKNLYKDTLRLLKRNWKLMEEISEKLIKTETLTGDDLNEIIFTKADKEL